MGSSTDATPILTKKHIHPKIKKPEVEGLKECANRMTSLQHITFDGRYGNILKLLEVNVQVDAISALAQFYDSPMRCFTFRDFQMAPTLEEFAQILGYPLENMKPYQHLGEYDFLPEVAAILKVKVNDLESEKKNRNGVFGFPQEYFEKRLRHLADVKDWDCFMEVLALAIFGIVLFPHIDNHIDLVAIDVFLAFRYRGESPIPAILADTYCTLTRCHEKKGKKLSCCLPTLYVWLITHAFNNKCIVSCPIADFKSCDVGIKSDQEWAQTLADLNERTVRWYPRWNKVHEVIYQCKNFPNVPLIGTKGCINYNPSVVLRQLCYPMMHPPTDELIAPFVVYEIDQGITEMLKRVRHAWDRIVRKGKELGKRSYDAKESYRQWLRERVQCVKLPFQSSLPAEEIPVQPMVDEKVQELKMALLKSEEDKRRLQGELEEFRRAYEKIQSENDKKTTSLEKVKKRAREEESLRIRVQENLRASDDSLTKRRGERNEALEDMEKLKRLLTDSKMAERSAKKRLEELKEQLEKVVAEYKGRIEHERQQKEELASIYHDLWRKEQTVADELKNQVGEQRKITEEFRQEAIVWMDHCAKLTWIANQAIRDVPELLREAEERIVMFNTPREIIKFIEHCKNLLEEMENLSRSRG